MLTTAKPNRTNRAKYWIVTLSLLLIVHLIFVAVDGTFLEPNINDSGNLIARMGRWILESRLFTEWITPYSFPFFNMFMTIQMTAILFQAIKEIKLCFQKNKEEGLA